MIKIPNSPSTSILFVVDFHKFNVVPEGVKYIFEIQLKGEVKQFFFIGSKFLSAPN